MPYTPQTWSDLPSQTTPITAARLSHIETQYDAVAADIDDPATPVGAALTAAADATVAAQVESGPLTVAALAAQPVSTATQAALDLKQDESALDAGVAGLVGDSGSDTAGALNAAYAPQASQLGSLARWKRKLAEDPANAVIYGIGDSTSDPVGAGQYKWERLRKYHIRWGQALEGMQSANVIGTGINGATLRYFLDGATTAYEAMVTAAPDLIIASWLLNDVRLGQIDKATARGRLVELVERIRGDLPEADIVLQIPNPMLTTDSGAHYVTEADGVTIASAATVRSYSRLIREAYLELVGAWPNVVVADAQAAVFGAQSFDTHPLMADQLHPSSGGGSGTSGGYVAIADYLASVVGKPASFMARQVYEGGAVVPGFWVVSAGSGYIDLGAMRGERYYAASQFPFTTSDTLYIEGYSTPISLVGWGIGRPFNVSNVRFTKTGDWSAVPQYARVSVVTQHPGETTGDRQVVATVDLPSIAAGAVSTTTVAVTGARTASVHDATSVTCTPPAGFISAGLLLLNCYPSANDTVTLVIMNPTGAPVDLGSSTFDFWVIR